tara:strand:- start:96 stop:506 length:411 start_codon:yes stop_codon:yes gene_type:complete
MSDKWKSDNKDYWVKWKIKNPDYYKKYRETNRLKIREYNKNYREQNYDKYLEYNHTQYIKKKNIRIEAEKKQMELDKFNKSLINLSSNTNSSGIIEPNEVTNNLHTIYNKDTNKFVIPVNKIFSINKDETIHLKKI